MDPMQPESDHQDEAAPPVGNIYDVDVNDPDSRLIDRSEVPAAEITQINELMHAMGELRAAEDRLNQASLTYMQLGKTDMRALHYLMVSENVDRVVTASALAAHLDITSASTTKLLDRLEHGGHIYRTPHPSDRRSQAIHITASTRSAAMETVGAQQSRRFYAAARLAPHEREVVIRFLRDTAAELLAGMDWGR